MQKCQGNEPPPVPVFQCSRGRFYVFQGTVLVFQGTVLWHIKYTYDAWGNHKVLNPDGTENANVLFVGNINPIRYRGYYYDVDVYRNCVPEKIKEITAHIRGANSK